MPDFVVSEGARLAVASGGPEDSIQHPVYGPGDKVTLTKEQAEPLIASGTVADAKADEKK